MQDKDGMAKRTRGRDAGQRWDGKENKRTGCRINKGWKGDLQDGMQDKDGMERRPKGRDVG